MSKRGDSGMGHTEGDASLPHPVKMKAKIKALLLHLKRTANARSWGRGTE